MRALLDSRLVSKLALLDLTGSQLDGATRQLLLNQLGDRAVVSA